MGVRILTDAKNEHACLYDSVTDTAFGPVFYSSYNAEEMAAHFRYWTEDAMKSSALEYQYDDLRELSPREITEFHAAWCKVALDEEGELTVEAHAKACELV